MIQNLVYKTLKNSEELNDALRSVVAGDKIFVGLKKEEVSLPYITLSPQSPVTLNDLPKTYEQQFDIYIVSETEAQAGEIREIIYKIFNEFDRQKIYDSVSKVCIIQSQALPTFFKSTFATDPITVCQKLVSFNCKFTKGS